MAESWNISVLPATSTRALLRACGLTHTSCTHRLRPHAAMRCIMTQTVLMQPHTKVCLSQQGLPPRSGIYVYVSWRVCADAGLVLSPKSCAVHGSVLGSLCVHAGLHFGLRLLAFMRCGSCAALHTAPPLSAVAAWGGPSCASGKLENPRTCTSDTSAIDEPAMSAGGSCMVLRGSLE